MADTDNAGAEHGGGEAWKNLLTKPASHDGC